MATGVDVAELEARIVAMEVRNREQDDLINRLLRQGGLKKLLNQDISRHAHQNLTAAPTETVEAGSIRTATIGGLYYVYAYINGGWRRVQVT